VLYVPVTEALFAAGIIPHYAANITGHGWRKIMRHPADLTYRIHTLPPVPPVLAFMQREAGINAHEAYGSLNMGAGFALFVSSQDADRTVKLARDVGVNAWIAGQVESGPRRVLVEPLNLEYAAHELHLRA
jgi:phosphoribosylformylglycinamidine cyclo-ligase